jgi:hypothetical protein
MQIRNRRRCAFFLFLFLFFYLIFECGEWGQTINTEIEKKMKRKLKSYGVCVLFWFCRLKVKKKLKITI